MSLKDSKTLEEIKKETLSDLQSKALDETQTNEAIIPVILSGGVGSRLWPKSRFNLPKPFVKIWDNSLLSTTMERLSLLGKPYCVTTQNLRCLTEKVFRGHELSPERVLPEPTGKNTAPAIAFLCRYLELKGLSEQIVGVFPADHFIEDEKAFLRCMELSKKPALDGHVVTLGVMPSHASSELGYIEVQSSFKEADANSCVLPVESFKEKPSKEKAQEFLESQKYLWNSGIFIFKVSTMIELFKEHQPEIWNAFLELKEDLSNLDQIYEKLPSISFDYAIMEKAGKVQCIPAKMGWSDVGTWDELIKFHKSSSQVVLDSAKDCHVVSQEKKTYGFIGVEDLILVDTKDATLIIKKGESSKVSNIIDQLKKENSEILYSKSFEERPWGNFEVLKDEAHFKSKVIQVEPGEKLSYQSHEKRSEHWIITKGKPLITLNEEAKEYLPKEHIFIEKGTRHSISNPTNELVEFIEIQLGEYFGEDDIKRFVDDYGRI